MSKKPSVEELEDQITELNGKLELKSEIVQQQLIKIDDLNIDTGPTGSFDLCLRVAEISILLGFITSKTRREELENELRQLIVEIRETKGE